ncbi:uncharacterized protein NPIL_406001 [Nephila pilipes]|uniref:Uncharacterized protein n=1 Tax=Nephila pilipes TaxID=299642 RepID=A0A8X6TPX1_NEPPI|nr:uncharacterized protein NPIL_406001 [Nephila pilipes]
MMKNRIYNRVTALYSVCFSSNLHLDDNAEPDSLNFSSSRREPREFVRYFNLKMPAYESFSYRHIPFVVFSVHSPFIQDDPSVVLSNKLKLGHKYEFNVYLKEEHLLPHPFPTNCTDYDELWRKNNKTGPRSKEACLKKCSESFEQRCWEYHLAREFFENTDVCSKDYAFCKKMELEEIPKCEMNCKVNCRKLKYYFTVKDTTQQLESR